jgi:hypothetical protein
MLLPDLPKKQMMADAYAAMHPSPELWRKFLAEVEKLKRGDTITGDDYLLLRNSIEIKSHLMDLTLGDEEALVEGTVAEVLAAYRSNLISGAEAKQKDAEAREQVLEINLQKVSDRIERCAASVASFARWALFLIFAAVLLAGSYASYMSDSQPALGVFFCRGVRSVAYCERSQFDPGRNGEKSDSYPGGKDQAIFDSDFEAADS